MLAFKFLYVNNCNTKCSRFSMKKHLSLMKKCIAFLTEQFRNRRPNLSLIQGIIMTLLVVFQISEFFSLMHLHQKAFKGKIQSGKQKLFVVKINIFFCNIKHSHFKQGILRYNSMFINCFKYYEFYFKKRVEDRCVPLYSNTEGEVDGTQNRRQSFFFFEYILYVLLFTIVLKSEPYT